MNVNGQNLSGLWIKTMFSFLLMSSFLLLKHSPMSSAVPRLFSHESEMDRLTYSMIHRVNKSDHSPSIPKHHFSQDSFSTRTQTFGDGFSRRKKLTRIRKDSQTRVKTENIQEAYSNHSQQVKFLEKRLHPYNPRQVFRFQFRTNRPDFAECFDRPNSSHIFSDIPQKTHL